MRFQAFWSMGIGYSKTGGDAQKLTCCATAAAEGVDERLRQPVMTRAERYFASKGNIDLLFLGWNVLNINLTHTNRKKNF